MSDYFAKLGTKPRESLPGPNGTVIPLSHPAPMEGGEGGTQPPAAAEPENKPAVPGTEPAAEPEDNPGEGEPGALEDGGPGAGPAEGEGGGKPPQDIEQRREQAAARREREFSERLESERARIIDETIAAMGFTDPYTGKPIKTRAEYEAFNRAKAEKELSESLEESGLDPQLFNKLISNHPEIIHAREAAQAAEAERRRALDASEQARAVEELKEIQKHDPKIQSIADLAALDNYEEIYQLVRAGASISKAYKLVNHDSILAKERAAAKQAALNEIAGKGHLQATQQQGGTGEEIPVTPSEREHFRQLYGKRLTDAEIRERKQKLYGKKG